jgi:hypothetical protein
MSTTRITDLRATLQRISALMLDLETVLGEDVPMGNPSPDEVAVVEAFRHGLDLIGRQLKAVDHHAEYARHMALIRGLQELQRERMEYLVEHPEAALYESRKLRMDMHHMDYETYRDLKALERQVSNLLAEAIDDAGVSA